jgi:hypothetical protein
MRGVLREMDTLSIAATSSNFLRPGWPVLISFLKKKNLICHARTYNTPAASILLKLIDYWKKKYLIAYLKYLEYMPGVNSIIFIFNFKNILRKI